MLKKREVKKVVKFGRKVAEEIAHVGKELAVETKQRVGKELKHVVEERIMSRSEAQDILKKLMHELQSEKERVAAFAKKELDREFRKAKPLVRKAVKRVRRGRK